VVDRGLLDNIRAVDMDQGALRLRTTQRSYRCFTEDRALIEQGREAFGRSARVTGVLYTSAGSLPIVVVDRIS